MKTWTKYLVIGWSIICVGIIIVSFQIMKNDYIKEDYDIDLLLKTPEQVEGGWTFIGESLYRIDKEEFLSKKMFLERVKKAKSLEVRSNNKVKNKSIYVILPIYAFMVWAFPILMLILLGNLFDKNKTPSFKAEG